MGLHIEYQIFSDKFYTNIVHISWFVIRTRATNIGDSSLDTSTHCFFHFSNCLTCGMYEPDRPCTLDKNSNGGVSNEHVDSNLSTTENITLLPARRLWPLNLAALWNTMRRYHPNSLMILWSPGGMVSCDTLDALYHHFC